ncbi:MAG: peptidase [Magnetococcales bacterium]|nr:peptidase [Magnetococcales bacterium]
MNTPSPPPKSLTIFRPGRHTDQSGAVRTFSEADLADCAAVYDPALHEAPLVIGHPADNSPAWGWAGGLQFMDNHLRVTPKQVDPDFQEIVNAGRYKKISAAFYLPDSPVNPKPGHLYLRHVGFLGAQPPAVKGLGDAAFADKGEGVVTVEFGEWQDRLSARMWRRMRDFLVAKFGVDEADRAVSDFDCENLTEEALRPEEPKPASFSESQPPKEPPMPTDQTPDPDPAIAEREKKLKEAEAALAEREKKLKEAEAAAKAKTNAAFAETLMKEGKILPRHQAGLAAFMSGLDEAGVVAFAEGEGKRVETSAHAWVQEFLGSLPKQVSYAEVAGKEKVPPGDNAAALAKAAQAYQFAEAQAGREVTTAQAVQHVMQGEGGGA